MDKGSVYAVSSGDVIRQIEAAAERRVTETEKRFQIMADVAPVLLWMSRTDSLCTFFNQTWLTFTGRTQEEEWGLGWLEGVYFEDLQRCLDTYVDHFNERTPFEMEYRLRRADGVFRWVLDRGTPRYHMDGTFAGFIGSCTDITDLRHIEGELRQALRAKDEFLGMMSHEMRTPLTSMRLQLERFFRDDTSSLSEKQDDALRRLRTTLQRMGGLIDSVLQFSRVARGRFRAQARPVDLREIAAQVLDEQREACDKKGLELRVFVPEDLPELDGDTELLRLILNNLVNNAIKYTDQGFVEVRIAVSGDCHTIAVRDSGRGIDPRSYKRIFEPFEQLEAVAHKHTPGVGLGLALVKAMTVALGGDIALESEVGRGSEFTVTLPSHALGGGTDVEPRYAH